MRARAPKGLTLIELVISLSLSTIVLVGTISIMSSMVQLQIEGGRMASVTGSALMSIKTMNKSISAGSEISYPNGAGAFGDSVVTCYNWSRLMGPLGGNGVRISFGAGTPGPSVSYYCYEPAAGVIRGMTTPGNCPNVGSAPPACSAALYGASSVIATGVYRNPANPMGGQPLFAVDATTSRSVRVSFVVGNPNQGTVSAGNPGTAFVNAQSIPFDTKIVLEN